VTPAAWGSLSTVLDLVSFVPFIAAALRGTARPSRIAWSIWTAEYAVLLLSEVTYGHGGLASTGIAAGEALGSAVLAAVGWRQYRTRRCPPDDDLPRGLLIIMSLGVAGALAAWTFVSPGPAVLLIVTVDLVAASVNAWKTYRSPAGENITSWWLFLASALIDLPAVPRDALILYAYPAVGALTAVIVISAWLLGRLSAARTAAQDAVRAAPASGSGTSAMTDDRTQTQAPA
jgi:hypothetical protein